MNGIRFSIALAAVCLVAFSGTAARADIGRAPDAPNQWFFSVEGGFRYLDTPGTHAYDIPIIGPDSPEFFDDALGGYGTGTLGFIHPDSSFWIFARTELYVSGIYASDEQSNPGGGTLAYSAPGFAINVSVSGPGVVTRAEQQYTLVETGMRLKAPVIDTPAQYVGLSLEPFLGYFRENTDVRILAGGAPISRTAEIDAFIYGAQLALEGEAALGPDVSAIGRISAGLYGAEADGAFGFSLPFPITASDDRNLFGGRFGGAIGLKTAIAPGISLSVVGRADYWTDLPTARLTQSATTTPSVGTAKTDFLNVGAGIVLTVVP